MKAARTLSRRDYGLLFALALIAAAISAAVLDQPGFTDAYYYFNAAARWTGGEGLTDPYIWQYLAPPESLPFPSHLYWMPLASFAAAFGGGNFDIAQVPFALAWAAMSPLAAWVGCKIGGWRRHGWAAGFLMIFSGFYFPYWTTTDTFSLFGLSGAGALIAMGLGRERRSARWFAAAGILSGLSHLARADGMLLAGVLVVAAVWPAKPAIKKIWIKVDGASQSSLWGFSRPLTPPLPPARKGKGGRRPSAGRRDRRKVHNHFHMPFFSKQLAWAAAGLACYALVMAPWLLRNLTVTGNPFPTSGTATIWLRGYKEIVGYDPAIGRADPNAAAFFAWDGAVNSRLEAVQRNAIRFVAEQAMIALAPLIPIALWRRRRDPFLAGLILYALGLHAAMTLAFAYPGTRGGLFHSAAALLPFWYALGLAGLDALIDWIAARRRKWRPAQAKAIFTVALIIWAAFLTGAGFNKLRDLDAANVPYARLRGVLPDDAVVMVNDPPAFYYFTGLGGVVVPDGGPEVVRALAARYGVTHLLLDQNATPPLVPLYEGKIALPAWLNLIRTIGGVKVYAVELDAP